METRNLYSIVNEYFDEYIEERTNAISEFGKVKDPSHYGMVKDVVLALELFGKDNTLSHETMRCIIEAIPSLRLQDVNDRTVAFMILDLFQDFEYTDILKNIGVWNLKFNEKIQYILGVGDWDIHVDIDKYRNATDERPIAINRQTYDPEDDYNIYRLYDEIHYNIQHGIAYGA